MFSRFAVRRRVTILMAVLVVLLLGGVSFSRINIDLFPSFDFPAAGVVTAYPGAAPDEVEAMVTRLVEEVMGRVSRVSEIASISMEEQSVVVVSFDWGTDMDYATLEMREQLDLVGSYFPAEAERPVVTAFDPSSMPVMAVAVSWDHRGGTGAGSDLLELTRFATDTVQPALERIDGVASVSVTGGVEEQVAIEVDRDRLAENAVSWSSLLQAVTGASLNLPGGSVSEAGQNLLVRSIGRIEDLDTLRALVVGARTVTVSMPAGLRPVALPVRLGDVAEVTLATTHPAEISRLNGEPCVTLAVRKAPDANSVAVSQQVRAELDRLRADVPAGVEVEVTMDQSEFISTAVGLVGTNAWQGALLAALVLLLFLRDLRSVLVISLAIPLSVVATFVLLYFSDLTLNLLTVGGLALGVGMLVDNSIVVLENIFRHARSGEAPLEAAVRGTEEVLSAISASTLTTVVVFLPVVFVGGIAGTLFRELAITVTFSLLSSLVVAVTFVPMAAATLFAAGASGRPAAGPAAVDGWYPRLLRGALRSRAVVVIGAALTLGLSLRLVGGIGVDFVPAMDRGEIAFNINLPAGSDLRSTDAVVQRVEDIARGIPEARFVVATAGAAGGARMDAASVLGGGTNVGSVQLQLVDRADRDRSADEVAADLARQLFAVRGGEVTVESVGSFMSMGGIRPVEVVLRGEDGSVLDGLAEAVAGVVRRTPGTVNIHDGRVETRPELHITYDRDRLAGLGLHPALVAAEVRAAFEGRRVGTVDLDGQSLDVHLRYAPAFRDGRPAVGSAVLVAPGGRVVALDEVADVVDADGPSFVQRQDGQRVLVVSAGVSGRDLSSVVADIVDGLGGIEFPAGYGYAVEGEYSHMQEAFSGLGLAMLLAVLLVYMVMAAQFESLMQPLVIMFTIPLAAVGVIVALRVTGVTLSVPSYIGVIMLGGIVVNNAIVLIDFINQERAAGVPRDQAVIEAGVVRLRPILMTTATTVLGLAPMAAASLEGSELARALATAVIGGLATSTLLTLVVIPVVYTLADDLGTVARNLGAGFRGRRPPAGSAASGPVGGWQ